MRSAWQVNDVLETLDLCLLTVEQPAVEAAAAVVIVVAVLARRYAAAVVHTEEAVAAACHLHAGGTCKISRVAAN